MNGVDESAAQLELLVLGSGPAGQKAAIQAAKLGRRVAVVERRARVGGSSIHTGTIPSKTLRQAVLEELARRALDVDSPYRTSAEHHERAAAEFLRDRTARVVATETAVVREQLRRNGVTLLYGDATFVDPHTVAVEGEDGDRSTVRAEHIVIAVGTVPARPDGITFDDRRVVDSDAILHLGHRVPRSMTVVGAGVIGVEYASMFAALGTRVTLVDPRARMLSFLDGEIGEALQYLLRRRGVTFRLDERVERVELVEEGALTHLASGKALPSETVLFAAGRQGAVAGLDLERAGLEADPRGRIAVDADFRTAVPHIFAAGDVAGPPGLAAAAFEQGRHAALAAFGRPAPPVAELLPTGVYAIPEVGMVGRTEEELTDAAVPFVAGVARWSELARGAISDDEDGMLKLLFSSEDRRLLGVHVLGTSAADLVHVGQAVMASGGGIDVFERAVFNYPTFAESYKVAALDALNRLEAEPHRPAAAASPTPPPPAVARGVTPDGEPVGHSAPADAAAPVGDG